MSVLFLFILLLFIMYLGLPNVAPGRPTEAESEAPDHWVYDPSKCRQDAGGKRYIAMGTTVLTMPPNVYFVRGAREIASDIRLTPPDPEDELGCRDNPNQVLFSPPFETILPNYRMVAQDLGIGLTRIGLAPVYGVGRDALLHGRPVIPPQPSPFRTEPALSEWVCEKPDASVEERDGVKTCRSPSSLAEPATSYEVDPPRYSTPAGDPFHFSCGRDAFRIGQTPCFIYPYATETGLAISYSFVPLQTIRTPDFIDRVIALDRRFRSALNAAANTHYPWRESATTNSTGK